MLAAYLVGSIPFGYLVAYWVKGIDIRTVGSGNLGATNVGRTLGFRYFLLVLLLDLLKGFLPTLGFPWLVEPAHRLGSRRPARRWSRWRRSWVIRFRSISSSGAARESRPAWAPCWHSIPSRAPSPSLVFGVLLVVTRYVSLSSLLGGLAFVAAHFLRDPSPLSREHIAMSLFSIAVLVLLFVRHRGNLARIWAGTETRVNFRPRSIRGRRPGISRCGKIVVLVLVVSGRASLVA